MRNVCAVLVFGAFLFAGCASAADLNSLAVSGNIVRLDIVKNGGVYQESLLWVRDLDAPVTPLQPVLLRCDGNGGGSLADCTSPYAFFTCALRHTTSRDIYTPTLTTDSYSCATAPHVGLCLDLMARVRPLDLFVYGVNVNGRDEPIQALSLDVTEVNYGSGCTS